MRFKLSSLPEVYLILELAHNIANLWKLLMYHFDCCKNVHPTVHVVANHMHHCPSLREVKIYKALVDGKYNQGKQVLFLLYLSQLYEQ